MKTVLRKVLGWVVSSVAVLLVLVGFSALRARRLSDEAIQQEVAAPPRLSTRLVLHPAKHMGGADQLGFSPGWVVTYAPRSKEYGTAFFVNFMGKLRARGTPNVVNISQAQARAGIARFEHTFSKMDSAIAVGSSYSDALDVLGTPITAMTNSDGSVQAFFTYHPSEMERTAVEWLTNGFTLVVSNGIIIHKGYSYTSNQ